MYQATGVYSTCRLVTWSKLFIPRCLALWTMLFTPHYSTLLGYTYNNAD